MERASYVQLITDILKQHNHTTIEAGPLRVVRLAASRSAIVQSNGGVLHGFLLYGLAGLFRKDAPLPKAYGRMMCDTVKAVFCCDGFFTSDELPRYRISERDVQAIYAAFGVQPADGHLIVLMAYPDALASAIRSFLVAQIDCQRRDGCG